MKPLNLKSRPALLALFSVILALILVGRLYYLQILHGEDYTQSFEKSVTRTVSIPAKRGRILDRNGIVIADTAASLNVTIVDNTGNTREENDRLNSIILKTLQILDQNGEETEGDFGISWDGSGYVFDYDGFEHLRFLADVYGYPLTDTLSEEERAASAEDVLLMLADRYRISRDLNTPDKAFLFLNTVVTRYRLALNAFQKYIPTVLARNVGSGTADAIVADSSLDGVSIANDYKRVYNDSLYLSSVTGYISLVSAQDLEEYGDLYNSGDYIGKVGIEASMEETLRGKNGRREISVDNLGREQNEISYVRPEEGNDVWLTIDSELQKNIYKILEMNMRNIILSKLTDEVNSFEITAETDGSDILIPAADVYGSLLSYKIDRDHFSAEDASDSERQMQGILNAYLESVKDSPEFPVLSMMLLRCMQKARYDARPVGHFGLAEEDYLHFTSPIRRYPDLIVHRMLTKYVFNQCKDPDQIAKDTGSMQEFADQSSIRERASQDAEYECDDMKKAQFMEKHIGEKGEGLITGVTSFGFYVELPNTVEGLVHISHLNDDYYTYDEDRMELKGSHFKHVYQLGQTVKVVCLAASHDTRQIDFGIDGMKAAPQRNDRNNGGRNGYRKRRRDNRGRR